MFLPSTYSDSIPVPLVLGKIIQYPHREPVSVSVIVHIPYKNKYYLGEIDLLFVVHFSIPIIKIVYKIKRRRRKMIITGTVFKTKYEASGI